MSDKKIPTPVPAHDPAAMQFNRFLLREAMHDQEFVQRIFERRSCTWKAREGLLIHLKECALETAVNHQSLIRACTEGGRTEIELKTFVSFIEPPSSSGIKKGRIYVGDQAGCRIDVNVDISYASFHAKQLQNGVKPSFFQAGAG